MFRIRTILLSLALLACLAGAGVAQPPAKGHSGQIDQLGLSAGQKARIHQILSPDKLKAEHARLALLAERKRLHETYDDYRLNEAKARDSIRKINSLQLDLLNISLDREIRIRSVLSSEQFDHLTRLVGPDRFGQGDVADGSRKGPRPRRPLPQLGLSSDQKDIVEKSWKKWGQESRDAFNDMQHNLQAMAGVYQKYRLDEGSAHRLIGKINKLQLRRLQLHLEHQEGLRKILSAQQFRTLREHNRQDRLQRAGQGSGPGSGSQ
jgi:Spy/CpxP family protein refolding chaperone